MKTRWDENDVRALYEKWGASVFTFCQCLLGDEEKAAAATQDAFLAFVRDGEPRPNRMPLKLIRHAMEASLNHGSAEIRFPATDQLEDTHPLLPPTERAVFILRSILDLPTSEIAVITGVTRRSAEALDGGSYTRS
jgi:DNA-directed RNA polymerase specialized sigma24 family protein